MNSTLAVLFFSGLYRKFIKSRYVLKCSSDLIYRQYCKFVVFLCTGEKVPETILFLYCVKKPAVCEV